MRELVHRSEHSFLRLVCVLTAAISGNALYATVVHAQVICSPFSYFQSLTETSKTSFQLQLNYVGEQDRPIAPVVLYANGGTADASIFESCYHFLFEHNRSPDYRVHAIGITTSEVTQILAAISGLPTVTDGGTTDTTYPFLAVSLSVALPEKHAFESIISESEAPAFFDALRSTLSSADARSAIYDRSSLLGMGPPGTPVDVTSSAAVSFSGVQLDRTTGHYVGTATVKNTSSTTFTAPVSLILFLTPGQTSLAHESGTTYHFAPFGRPFVDSDSPLPPGASVEFRLEFANPRRVAIQPTATVVAGPGTR